MMEITYFGHSCFRIRTKSATVVTDPFDPAIVGLKYPKVPADIVTISHQHADHNFLEKITGQPFVIDGPGEYEVKGISVFGVASFHDEKSGSLRGSNTIYLFEAEDLRICHLGDLGQKLTEGQLNQVNGADVLLIPVGGVYTIDPDQAAAVVGQIEPQIVAPMHYKAKGMSKDFENLATVDEFLKSIGVEVKPIPKLLVTKDKLPEEREIVVMEKKK